MEEAEHLGNNNNQVSAHHGIDHEIAQRLTGDDTPYAGVTSVDGNEVAVSVTFTCCTSRHAHTQRQCLLDNQHQHRRDHRRAIATRRIEDRNLFDLQRTSGDEIITSRIVSGYLFLDSGTHLCRHSQGRLINRLISQHQCHVTIHTDRALLHAVQSGGKILWNEIDALHHLTAYQRLGIIKVNGITGHLHIRRGITHTDKLARQL